MKKNNGFTIIEVTILFVIFLIVAFLVAPLSLDDTIQAKNVLRWKNVQSDFSNILYAVKANEIKTDSDYSAALDKILQNDTKATITPYKIVYMNGKFPDEQYVFDKYMITYANAIIAVKYFNDNQTLKGVILYDVNGKNGPNTWGKDVFGINIYNDRFEPFGYAAPMNEQKKDCSRKGTGLFCSNYYLIGGDFD